MKNLFACFVLILTLSSCQNEEDRINKELAFTYDTIKVESKNEFTKNGRYIAPGKVTIEFPIFKSDTINKFIAQKVFNFFDEKEQSTSFQDIADSFIEGYDDFANKSEKVVEQPWSLMINIRVLRKSPTYLSLKYMHYDYVGGAHGNTLISFLNYNPTTNTSITIDSLIQNDKMQALIQVAERIFRKNEKLSTTESLEEKYFFEKGKFKLAENFHVSDSGLLFMYNPYEIKPYSEGYTELLVPFSALKNMAKPKTILTTQP